MDITRLKMEVNNIIPLNYNLELTIDKIHQSIENIKEIQEIAKLTNEQLRVHIQIQQRAWQSIMLTVKGLDKLMVEKITNMIFELTCNTLFK